MFLRIFWPSSVPLEERRIHCTLQLPKSKWLVYPPWNVHNQPRIRYRHKRVQETEKRDRRSSCRNLLGRLLLKWWGGFLVWLIHYTPPFSNLPRINFKYSRYVRIKTYKVLHMYFRSWNNFLNNHLKNWKTLKSADSKTVSFRNMPTLIFMYPFSWSLKSLMTIQSQCLIPEVLAAKKLLGNCFWMFLGCGRAAGWHLPVGNKTLTTIYFQFVKKEILKTYCMVLILCSKTKEGKRKILYYTVYRFIFQFQQETKLMKKKAIAKWSNTIQTLGNKHKKDPFNSQNHNRKKVKT